jgi:hypothetical protein
MITLLPEVHDRSTSNRDAFAAEHGLVREAPRSWSSKPVTEQPPAEVPETPAASSAKEIPLLTFRRDDELGECFERETPAGGTGSVGLTGHHFQFGSELDALHRLDELECVSLAIG